MDHHLPAEFINPTLKGTTFGGYNKKEIHKFLAELSKEWGKMQEANHQLEQQLQASKAEISRLHGLEAQLIDELSRLREDREALLKSSEEESRIEVMKGRLKAEKIISDAKDKAEAMIRDAQEKYQYKMDIMRHELHTVESNYNVVQSHADKLIKEIMDVMDTTLDQINRLTSVRKIATLEDKLLKTHQVLNALTVRKSLEEPDRYSEATTSKDGKRTRISSKSTVENGTLAQPEGGLGNGRAAGDLRSHSGRKPENSNSSFFDQVK